LVRLLLFAALVAVPIAEIAVFLVVGDVIGVLPTLGLIVLTALLGAILLRRQGLAAFGRLQADIHEKRVPAAAIGHAITVAIAGALLLTPGFLTDAVGFLLFVPAVRSFLWRQILSSVRIERFEGGAGPSPYGAADRPPRGARVIDLEDEDYAPRDPASPWRGDGER
jgi:UPF0716 protein FxsA